MFTVTLTPWHFSVLCVYTCVHMHLCEGFMDMCVQTWRVRDWSPLYFSEAAHTEPGVHWAGLTCLPAPRSLSDSVPLHWDCRCTLPCLAFMWVQRAQICMLVWQAFYRLRCLPSSVPLHPKFEERERDYVNLLYESMKILNINIYKLFWENKLVHNTP